MVRIIVMANQKGGVGKTTSTVNLGAYLAEYGKKVLLVDFDPQSNLSSSVNADRTKPSIYQLLADEAEPSDCIQETSVEGLYIIPATPDLAGITVELVNQGKREYFLKNAIKSIQENYDFVLIDSPPSLDVITINGLTAANEVLIPVQTEYFALEGITQLMKTITNIKRTTNPQLKVTGIILTMYSTRTRLAQDVAKEVIGYFGQLVFQTIIPRNVRLSEAPSHSLPINQYDPSCSGAESYQLFAREVLSRV